MKNGKGRPKGVGGKPKTVVLNEQIKAEMAEVGELVKQQTGMRIISYRQILDVLIHSYKANNQ